jgi:hypothetical protein
MPRPLHEIAREIRSDWKPVDYSAKPYLEAMMDLENLDDKYGQDDGRYIVNYFLSNSGKWRGDTAKRVKAELKQMVGRRASDDLTTRVAMRHTAAGEGDIDVGTAITTVRGTTFRDRAVLRPTGYGNPGSYVFVVPGGGSGWVVEDFLRGSGPLYIDFGQDWVLVNADELRAEVRAMMPKVERGGGSAVGAPPPEADGILTAARDMRVAANSGNQMRVRRAMVAMLNEMTPFCDYLGESDVTARFKLLARDLASRG